MSENSWKEKDFSPKEIKEPQKRATWFDRKGKITGFIGTGENAKNSILYLVLKYAFLFAIIVIAIYAINLWFFCSNNNNNLLSGILEISKVVVPIITLALGYVFGQNKL